MYDTARRVELVKRQIRKNTRRRQKRGIGRLSAVTFDWIYQEEGAG